MRLKKSLFTVIVVIMALLASCASSTSPAVSLTPEPEADTSASFDGFWELPNGQFQIFKNNAFILINNERTIISAGIFTYTDTQFKLNLESELYVIFDYVFESGNLKVSGVGNEWAHGIWKKVNYNNSSNNLLAGYWEYKSDNEIRILYILPFGIGTWYTCDIHYELIEKFNIRYEENNRSEFRQVRRGDDFNISFPVKYKFDGADLIVNEGQRYIKR